MRRLTNVLDKFKNQKHIYHQLGLPHKLGLMFYGAPGTGKTTTIKAVASYLHNDLYLVDLPNVATNADLKAIFDHINDKCHGGVIVFEDIDACTKLVQKRTTITEQSLTDTIETANDNLTLSYLLNLLDEWLCQDGTIFAITTNCLQNLDLALYRKGRVDVTIEFKKCDDYQIDHIYQAILGRPLAPHLLACIPEDVYAPADIIFHVYQFMLEEVADEIIMADFMVYTPLVE